MIKIVKVRLVVLADNVRVPMLPLGRVGHVVGFRFVQNTVDVGPTTVNFAARNGPGTEHVEGVVTGVPYIVSLPVFGDEEDFVVLSSANTASAYSVDAEFLIQE